LGMPWQKEGKGLEVIVSEPDPSEFVLFNSSKNMIPLVSTEWVFQCLLLRKRLSFEGFEFQKKKKENENF